ncbi:MAG: BlaI/MecI/CopY family transcriptional regulator [Oscillospiraceae bacterium]|jgi:BlaI family penicillinase repressor|nr:BlaI/MecI/CopY family transcriptional regulator [Oscillospiraceae bacterium]
MAQKISDAELEVMEAVWQLPDPCTSAQLQTALSKKNWKQTTLLTFLTRLTEKGLLTTKKQGKQNLYSPALSREGYLARETRSFLAGLHGGSLRSFIAALNAGEKLQEEELDELRSWLESQ